MALLLSQAKTRVPDLVPIRHGRMLVSPFTFYSGAALIMAADLESTPASGLQTQLCGDAHLSNFGAYASPERRLVFDINDFDETLPGPFEWDVKRLGGELRGGRPRQRLQQEAIPQGNAWLRWRATAQQCAPLPQSRSCQSGISTLRWNRPWPNTSRASVHREVEGEEGQPQSDGSCAREGAYAR